MVSGVGALVTELATGPHFIHYLRARERATLHQGLYLIPGEEDLLAELSPSISQREVVLPGLIELLRPA